MNVTARVSSKGQVTIPKAVRDALGVTEGDALLFKVDGKRAVVTRIPNFIELAGSVYVPPEKRGKSWDEIRSETRRIRAAARH